MAAHDPNPDPNADTRLADLTTAAVSPKSPSSSTGWLSSSGTIDHGRFEPGTLLGGRYRIIGRLGRGGMGEVYRADDLKLGQAVALKFLPPDVDRDPARLTQLHTEVRMARQVSHPNVCRVYDIDEVEGHTFLSMEYVDGEDLSTLLRRIGRFPEERGVEIARQICAGLAAAHERGVVHRDFKPANVMVDGTGKIRITDFGLAGVAGESLRAGTPAYMAPEQLAGGEVTPRSDIYALGLVLYELFTGQRALDGKNLAELIHKREQSGITPPTELVRDLSPEIERTIQRCLRPDPAQRPASALTVSASLPGGDPLAAALAAGETPSPEMVAAAGEEGALSRWPGIALLSLTVVALIGTAVLSEQELLVNRMTFAKTADALEDRSREIIAAAGYTDPPADTARGVSIDADYLSWLARTKSGPSKWDTLTQGHAPILRFWYRTSPQLLVPVAPLSAPDWGDPTLGLSGMLRMAVDDRGRLLEFTTMPPQLDRSTDPAPATDWKRMFDAAGLTMAEFAEVPPQWTPRIYADQRVAWEGPMPGHPEVKLRVEGASYRGRPVNFMTVGPWTQPGRMVRPGPAGGQRALDVGGTILVLALMVGAVLLVRWNLKSGRADRRGAARVTLFLLGVWLATWVLGARHWLDVETEMNMFLRGLAFALINTGFTWLFYLALEPFVRRLYPDMLISWTRLLAGQLRDPRVGRDILIGVATGVYFAMMSSINVLFPLVTDRITIQPEISNMQFFLGQRFAIAHVLRGIPNALSTAMLGAFTYVVLMVIARRQWLAVAIVAVLFGLVIVTEGGEDPVWLSLIFAAVLIAPLLFVFFRYGLLAIAVALLINQTLHAVPLTVDLTRPHAFVSSLVIVAIVAIAAFGFRTSRAGEGLLRRLMPQA